MRRSSQESCLPSAAKLLLLMLLGALSAAIADAAEGDEAAAAAALPPSWKESEQEQQQQQPQQQQQQQQQQEQITQASPTQEAASNDRSHAPSNSTAAISTIAEAVESAAASGAATTATLAESGSDSTSSTSSNEHQVLGNATSNLASGEASTAGHQVEKKQDEQKVAVEAEHQKAEEREEDKELAERLGVSASDVGNLRGSIARNETELAALSASLGSCDSPERPLDARCTGCPPMYNGKLCATTTWYEDHTKGSCGCGDAPMVSESYWTLTSFTAALNTASLDPKNPANTYCLAGCGTCYEICTTGGVVNSMDTLTPHSECQVFKVTNRCADGWYEGMGPNWCSQQMSYDDCKADPHKCKSNGNTNMYGYAAHFDLQDAHRQIQNTLGWMNPEVTFEAVDCSLWNGPDGSTCPGCEERPWWWR